MSNREHGHGADSGTGDGHGRKNKPDHQAALEQWEELTPEQKKIMRYLGQDGGATVGEIAQATGLTVEQVQEALSGNGGGGGISGETTETEN